MVFKYDVSKFKEYRQNGIFRALLLMGISIFLMPPILTPHAEIAKVITPVTAAALNK